MSDLKIYRELEDKLRNPSGRSELAEYKMIPDYVVSEKEMENMIHQVAPTLINFITLKRRDGKNE